MRIIFAVVISFWGLSLALADPTVSAPPMQLPPHFTNSLQLHFEPVPGTKVLFSTWLTRVQDYRAFAQATGTPMPPVDFPQTPHDPITMVSWEDAKAFCAWLTTQEQSQKIIPATAYYRLPTSQEWSLAVGLPPAIADGREEPTDAVYPWGTQWPPPKNAGNYNPGLGVDSFPYTSPVGSFPPNPFGLYDMGGNVWEWCEDIYNNSPDYRILRGASWRLRDPEDLASTKVIGNKPDLRLDVYGFRLVLVDSKD